jgi:hypothetical protein
MPKGVLGLGGVAKGVLPSHSPHFLHIARLPDKTIFEVLDDFEQGEQTREGMACRENGQKYLERLRLA